MTSLLLQATGNSPALRIIDFLIENKGLDFSKTEVARGAGLSRATVYSWWQNIERFGLVKVTRSFGKTKLYTLNAKSPVIKKLLELERALIKEAMRKHIKAKAIAT